MSNNYSADRASATQSILRFGRTLYLRNTTTLQLRAVLGAVVRRRPSSRAGNLDQFTPRHAIISGETSPAPDHENEMLVEGVTLCRIVAPPRVIAPSGFVIFYDLDIEDVGIIGTALLPVPRIENESTLRSLEIV